MIWTQALRDAVEAVYRDPDHRPNSSDRHRLRELVSFMTPD